MPRSRKEIEDLEKLVGTGVKKYVRLEEGKKLYSLGTNTFRELAKDAGAIYRIKRVVLYNVQIIDEYLESFKDDDMYY